MAFVHRRRQILLFGGDHRVDKVGEMISLAIGLRSGFLAWTEPRLIGIVALDGEVALRPVENVSDGIFRAFSCVPTAQASSRNATTLEFAGSDARLVISLPAAHFEFHHAG